MAAYICAASIACLSAAPYVYFTLTPQYHGIALMGQDAEEHYLARMQEVYDGHPALGDVFLPEKNIAPLIPGLDEDALAYTGMLLRLSAVQIDLAAKFAFPFLIFLSIYALAYAISASRAAGIAAAVCGMLLPAFMSNPAELSALAHGTSLTDGIMWARPIDPEVSDLFLFGTLYFFYRIRSARSWLLFAAAGASIGISLYVSVYTWSFFGAFVFVSFLYALWRREFADAKRLLLSGCVSLACALPFAFHYLENRGNPAYAAAAARIGALPSHLPITGVWLFVCLALPIFLWPKKIAAARPFFILCASALVVVLNQQIITGFYLQPGHIHWYITKPLAGVMLGLVGAWAIERYAGRVRIAAYAVLCSILFLQGIFSQEQFYIHHAPEAAAAQQYAPLFAYLRGDMQQSVYADQTLSNYIPIYTGDDAPGSWYAAFYAVPENFLEERLFLEYRLRGIRPDEALQTLLAERDAVSLQINGSADALSDAQLQALAQAYVPYATEPLPSMMRDLGITTLVDDTSIDGWSALALADMRLAKTIDGRFAVYTAI